MTTSEPKTAPHVSSESLDRDFTVNRHEFLKQPQRPAVRAGADLSGTAFSPALSAERTGVKNAATTAPLTTERPLTTAAQTSRLQRFMKKVFPARTKRGAVTVLDRCVTFFARLLKALEKLATGRWAQLITGNPPIAKIAQPAADTKETKQPRERTAKEKSAELS